MTSIELIGGERAEGAPLVGVFDRVNHLAVGDFQFTMKGCVDVGGKIRNGE